MALKIDLRVPAAGTAQEVAAFARRAEDAGFDGVGITDMPMVLSDGFVSMATAAQATSSIRVASAVTNSVTRHVSVLASAAQTLAELAPGRVEIWIGRGDSAVYTVGLAPASVNQMREFILTLKALLAGEQVNINGTGGTPAHRRWAPVPIYVAADGLKAIALAGEVADGLLLRVALHPKVVETAMEHLAEGAKRAGRDSAEIAVIYFAPRHHPGRPARSEGASPASLCPLAYEEGHGSGTPGGRDRSGGSGDAPRASGRPSGSDGNAEPVPGPSPCRGLGEGHAALRFYPSGYPGPDL